MKKEKEAILLRIFIGEADEHKGKRLYIHILELLKKRGIAGATVIRGISGFGRKSILHTASILRLSSDLPIVIEVVDEREKIEEIKKELDEIIKEGLITEEKVKVIFYG